MKTARTHRDDGCCCRTSVAPIRDHRSSEMFSGKEKPSFRTDLLLSRCAPLCPPFLALVLEKLSALVLQRGALTAVLVPPLFGVGALDWAEGALRRTWTPPEVRSAPPIHSAPAGTSGYLHRRSV